MKEYRIGVDIGGTKCAIGIVDKQYNILSSVSYPTDCKNKNFSKSFIPILSEKINSLLDNTQIGIDSVAQIGVAFPGDVDIDTGNIGFANNLNLSNFPIRNLLKEYFQTTLIRIENDANAAALGEYLVGALKGCDSGVIITLGTGIGAGIICNGRIYRGFNGAAGEVGHMVIQQDGIQCNCGRRGCWEMYASASGLVRMAKQKMLSGDSTALWELTKNDLDNLNGEIIFKAAQLEDAMAKKIVASYIKYVGTGIVNIINLLQPDIICLGGGICRAGELFLDSVREFCNQETYKTKNHTAIVRAKLKNEAGIVGAAFLQ